MLLYPLVLRGGTTCRYTEKKTLRPKKEDAENVRRVCVSEKETEGNSKKGKKNGGEQWKSSHR